MLHSTPPSPTTQPAFYGDLGRIEMSSGPAAGRGGVERPGGLCPFFCCCLERELLAALLRSLRVK